MKYFLIYLLIINFIGFFAMFLDKQKAKGGKWRIPEKTLFLLALIGGSLGTTVGMHAFRHKTKHWYFVAINLLGVLIHLAGVIASAILL